MEYINEIEIEGKIYKKIMKGINEENKKCEYAFVNQEIGKAFAVVIESDNKIRVYNIPVKKGVDKNENNI